MNEYAKSDESHLLRPERSIRLTGYADTVVWDEQPRPLLAALRFGGYPEAVRGLSDATYGGATITIESDNWSLQLNTTARQYRQELGHDGVYAEATLVLDDDGQGSKGDKNDKKKPKESNNIAKIYLNRKIRPQKGHIMRVEHGVSFLISLVFP